MAGVRKTIVIRRKAWTDTDDAAIRRGYPDGDVPALAVSLGRTVGAIQQRARNIGVRKSAEFKRAQGIAIAALKLGQFKPGHITWNAGRKGWQPGGRSKASQFKAGKIPPNRREVGALRMAEDGFIYIKMREGLRQWVQLSHYAWFLAHGDWPAKGEIVRASNGDTHDTQAHNLEKLTRAENMRRNSYHTNYPPEVARLVQIKGAIMRQVNRINREARA